MKLSQIAVDVKRENAGDWVPLRNLKGIEVKVRSIHCADYRRLQNRKIQELMESIQAPVSEVPEVSADDAERISRECIHEVCLMDWKGLEDDNGKRVAYSKAVAETLMFEPEYRKFQDGAAWAASRVGEKVDVEKTARATAKNSRRRSRGK